MVRDTNKEITSTKEVGISGPVGQTYPFGQESYSSRAAVVLSSSIDEGTILLQKKRILQ